MFPKITLDTAITCNNEEQVQQRRAVVKSTTATKGVNETHHKKRSSGT